MSLTPTMDITLNTEKIVSKHIESAMNPPKNQDPNDPYLSTAQHPHSHGAILTDTNSEALIPFINSFEEALCENQNISQELQRKQTSLQQSMSQQSNFTERTQDLSRAFACTHKSLESIKQKYNDALNASNASGARISHLFKLKQRARQTKELFQIYLELALQGSDQSTRLTNLHQSDDLEARKHGALMMRRLWALCDIPKTASNGQEMRMIIKAQCEAYCDERIALFKEAHDLGEVEGMHEQAVLLECFNGGNEIIEEFISKHALFTDRETVLKRIHTRFSSDNQPYAPIDCLNELMCSADVLNADFAKICSLNNHPSHQNKINHNNVISSDDDGIKDEDDENQKVNTATNPNKISKDMQPLLQLFSTIVGSIHGDWKYTESIFTNPEAVIQSFMTRIWTGPIAFICSEIISQSREHSHIAYLSTLFNCWIYCERFKNIIGKMIANLYSASKSVAGNEAGHSSPTTSIDKASVSSTQHEIQKNNQLLNRLFTDIFAGHIADGGDSIEYFDLEIQTLKRMLKQASSSNLSTQTHQGHTLKTSTFVNLFSSASATSTRENERAQNDADNQILATLTYNGGKPLNCFDSANEHHPCQRIVDNCLFLHKCAAVRIFQFATSFTTTTAAAAAPSTNRKKENASKTTTRVAALEDSYGVLLGCLLEDYVSVVIKDVAIKGLQKVSVGGDSEKILHAIKSSLQCTASTMSALSALHRHTQNTFTPLSLTASPTAHHRIVEASTIAFGQVGGLLNDLLSSLLTTTNTQASKLLAAHQTKTDYRPDTSANGDLEALTRPTNACKALCRFLSQVIALSKAHLSVDNHARLMDGIQSALFSSLCRHFRKYTFNSTGALVLLNDVKAYKELSNQLQGDTATTLQKNKNDNKFDFLLEIANVFLVKAENLRLLMQEGLLGALDNETILLPWLRCREDFDDVLESIPELAGVARRARPALVFDPSSIF